MYATYRPVYYRVGIRAVRCFHIFMVDTRAYDTGPTYLELASLYLRGSVHDSERSDPIEISHQTSPDYFAIFSIALPKFAYADPYGHPTMNDVSCQRSSRMESSSFSIEVRLSNGGLSTVDVGQQSPGPFHISDRQRAVS
jgi:hypothetical protein